MLYFQFIFADFPFHFHSISMRDASNYVPGADPTEIYVPSLGHFSTSLPFVATQTLPPGAHNF